MQAMDTFHVGPVSHPYSKGILLKFLLAFNLSYEGLEIGEYFNFNFSTKAFDLAFLNVGDDTPAVWVNGTKLWSFRRYDGRYDGQYDGRYDGQYDGRYDVNRDVVPHTSFPFTRLASINVPEKSSYLYHQINETILAEEQYDLSLHEWLTTYITVPNS